MSSNTTQSSLIKKLSASAEGVCPEGAAHELKKIQAAVRGDFAAVSFLLLKELEDLRSRFSAVHEELAEAEEEVAGRRDADEKNHALYTKTRKELAIYKSLHSSNAATHREMFGEKEELKKQLAEVQEKFERKCEHYRVESKHMYEGFEEMDVWHEQDKAKLRTEIGGLRAGNKRLEKQVSGEYEAKEELRQQLGYNTVELEESQRTIKHLEQTVADLGK